MKLKIEKKKKKTVLLHIRQLEQERHKKNHEILNLLQEKPREELVQKEQSTKQLEEEQKAKNREIKDVNEGERKREEKETKVEKMELKEEKKKEAGGVNGLLEGVCQEEEEVEEAAGCSSKPPKSPLLPPLSPPLRSSLHLLQPFLISPLLLPPPSSLVAVVQEAEWESAADHMVSGWLPHLLVSGGGECVWMFSLMMDA